MPDFLSPADRQAGRSVAVGKPGRLRVAEKEVAERFEKKMGEVAGKQRESEAKRRAARLGFPHIDLARFPVSDAALRQVARAQAEQWQAVCFFFAQDELRLGAVEPTKPEVKELLYHLEERNHARGALYVISEDSLQRVLGLYARLPEIVPINKEVVITEEELSRVQTSVRDFRQLQSLVAEASTTDLLTFLLGAALKLLASDVHVEAKADKIAVRFRLDGILHEAATLAKADYRPLVARIKLVASLKINITDNPQDGRFTIKLAAGDVDVRVSTVPTVYGESVVMRLLPQNQEGLSFDQLGLAGESYQRLQREIERPNGMIITTGPTGSGKTTTLYAIMRALNKPGVKVITLEDPVEYRIAGINQSQVDESRGYTFAKGLKYMLRQDPDIAMVGEVRDLETAEIAIQSALTGHLVLSTLHANSAAGAIPRFLSMGVKPFLLAPALNAVIGQRLLRRLCEKCKQAVQLTPERQARVDEIMARLPVTLAEPMANKVTQYYTSSGCAACSGLGYKGRIGIYEVLLVTKEVEQIILSGEASELKIEEAVADGGMITMAQDGILKARAGITSVEEVFRVIE